MNKKQAWLELCIKHNPKLYGNDAKIALNYYLLGKGIIKHIEEEQLTEYCQEYYNLDNECDYCGKPLKRIEDCETGTGYWSTESWHKYHKDCKHLRKQNEVEQQKIDQNCNDCTYYERKKRLGGYFGDSTGYCNRLNKETQACAKPYCTGLEHDNCFKHRIEE